jgi:hypothetical protein
MGCYSLGGGFNMASKSMKWNKKGLLARDYVIMLILFFLIAGIGALLVSDISSNGEGYNVNNMSNPSFDANYNKLSETAGDMARAGNQTRTGLGKLLGNVDVFFSSTSTVLDIVFGSFTMVNAIFSNFAQDFGMPPQIANLIFPALLAIITTIIVFVAISSLTKSKM